MPRPEIPDAEKPNNFKLCTTAHEFDELCKKNMLYKEHGTYYACACGSRKFHLLQQNKNFKAICAKCWDSRILAWNDSCRVLDLGTLRWCRPMLAVVKDDK